jgi:hypothetical protein
MGLSLRPAAGLLAAGLLLSCAVPAAASAPAGAHLTYYGGPVISHVKVADIIYGPGTYVPQVTSTSAPSFSSFFAQITNSRYLDWLTEYDTPSQTIGRGTFIGQYTIAPASLATTVDDTTIQSELKIQIAAGHVPYPDGNTVYFLFFPQNVTITIADGNGGTAASGQQFCSYHRSFVLTAALNVRYAVMPDFNTGGLSAGCGGAVGLFNNMTAVASNELLNAITDPDVALATTYAAPMAWYDNSTLGGEIAILCNAQQSIVQGGDGFDYTVNQGFSNLYNNCIDSVPTPTILSPIDGFTTSNGNLSVSGTAYPNAPISVLDGGVAVGSANADISGSWSVALSLAFGPHTLTATEVLNGRTGPPSAPVNVTIIDADLSIYGLPSDITVDAGGPQGTVVSYAAPTATDGGTRGNGYSIPVSCTPSSGATFGIGTTTVTCSAGDADDTPQSISQTFRITVRDNDLALTAIPANISAIATGANGAAVSYATPTAVDETGDGGVPVVSCAPGSGTMFPLGTTTVSCTASDPDDSASPPSATFTVSVLVDLRLVMSVNPGTATSGTVVSTTLSLTNLAAASRTVTLSGSITYLGTGQTFNVTTLNITVTLAQGQQIGRTFSFMVSRALPRGTYVLSATANDRTGAVHAIAAFTVI